MKEHPCGLRINFKARILLSCFIISACSTIVEPEVLWQQLESAEKRNDDQACTIALERLITEHKSSQAMVQLADRYYAGKGVPQDKQKTLELYVKASNKNNSDALWWLALQYDSGELVERNWNTANFYYHAAADQGHAKAMAKVGVIDKEKIKARLKEILPNIGRIEQKYQDGGVFPESNMPTAGANAGVGNSAFGSSGKCGGYDAVQFDDMVNTGDSRRDAAADARVAATKARQEEYRKCIGQPEFVSPAVPPSRMPDRSTDPGPRKSVR